MKEKKITEIAEKMKLFEKEIICESKDVTIKAFWEPCPEEDGTGSYIVNYIREERLCRGAITRYVKSEKPVWMIDDFGETTPGLFINLLFKLEDILNGKDTKN